MTRHPTRKRRRYASWIYDFTAMTNNGAEDEDIHLQSTKRMEHRSTNNHAKRRVTQRTDFYNHTAMGASSSPAGPVIGERHRDDRPIHDAEVSNDHMGADTVRVENLFSANNDTVDSHTLPYTGFVEADADDSEVDDISDDPESDVRLSGLTGCALLHFIAKRSRFVTSWERMLGFVSITGPSSLSCEQYALMCSALRTCNDDVRLRTYKTLRGTQWNHFLANLFPGSCLYQVGDNVSRPTVRGNVRMVRTAEGKTADPRCCSRVVLPSEWAKLDVASYDFYKDVYLQNESHHFDNITIESAPICTQRTTCIGSDASIWVTHKDSCFPVQTGVRIQFVVRSLPHMGSEDIQSYGWHVRQRQSKHVLVGVCGPSWTPLHAKQSCVHSEVDMSVLTTHERDIYNACRHATSGGQNRSGYLAVRPGDMCFFFRPIDNSACARYVCLFVASFAAVSEGDVSERLVFLDTSSAGQSQGGERCFAVLDEVCVLDLPEWVPSDEGVRPGFPPSPQPPLRGTLEDGTPYVVYRLSLYYDGFKQHKSLADSRSVNGCYMMPMGLPPAQRKSSSSARVLSLGPHGQDIRQLLKIIVDDVVVGSSTGVEGFDPYGRKVRIFLDPVVYIGDFFSFGTVSACMGHTADACCPLCRFTKLKGSSGSQIAWNTTVHSRRLGYMRTDNRTSAVYGSSGTISQGLKKSLGLQTVDKKDMMERPLVYLSERLQQNLAKVPRTDKGLRPAPCMFDSFLSSAACPDHAVTGLIKDVLDVCFGCLRTTDDVLEAETRILVSAAENSLPFERKIVKWERGTYSGLYAMSMTTLFSILFCAAQVFERHAISCVDGEAHPFLLPAKLQNIVTLIYFLPQRTLDGTDAFNFVRGDNGTLYHGALHRAVRDYLENVHHTIESGVRRASRMDKPNLHRVLELCVHTIPIFGHAHNVSELVFEQAHRKFKNWLEKNTHFNSHITAMDMALSKDWSWRIYRLYALRMQACASANVAECRALETGLMRLALGHDALSLDRNHPAVSMLLDKIFSSLSDAFRPPVLCQLQACCPVNFGHSGYRWEAQGTFRSQSAYAAHRSVIDKACDGLDSNPAIPLSTARISFRERAVLTPVGCIGARKPYGHNVVRPGCIVSVRTEGGWCAEEGELVATSATGTGDERFFAVAALFTATSDASDAVYAFVREMENNGDDSFSIGVRSNVLQFCASVQRVAWFHVCDAHCEVDVSRCEVVHGCRLFQGAHALIRGRRRGYPTYMA